MRRILWAILGIVFGLLLTAVLGPLAERMGRPVVKATTKAGLTVYRGGRDRLMQLRETLDDILAESRHELK